MAAHLLGDRLVRNPDRIELELLTTVDACEVLAVLDLARDGIAVDEPSEDDDGDFLYLRWVEGGTPAGQVALFDVDEARVLARLILARADEIEAEA